MKPAVFLSGVFLAFSACTSVKEITFSPHKPFDETLSSDSLRIQFNGTACFYIQHKETAVLTDPFITNPGFAKVSFGKIKTDTLLLNRLQPKTHNIKLLAIGHAHYDHILDLPYFVPKLSNNAKIIGSFNAVEMAKTLDIPNAGINAGEVKATTLSAGSWIYASDSSVRILPIQSAHLPHLLGIHLYQGKHKKTINTFPVKGRQFLEDETLAYLIDFLDTTHKPEKRIYFSSSAVSYPNGYFPKDLLNEKTIDVAIISTALFQKASGYPNALIEYLQPKHTILCHWENFFKNREQKLKLVSLTRHHKMFKALENLKALTLFYHIKPGNSWAVN